MREREHLRFTKVCKFVGFRTYKDLRYILFIYLFIFLLSKKKSIL